MIWRKCHALSPGVSALRVDRGAYESAVREYRPEQHGGLGDLLVEQGVILGSMIQEAARQRAVAQASPAWS